MLLGAAALQAQTNTVADVPANGTNAVPPLPRWEVGVFGGGTRMPHYRGSDEYRTYAFPMPYVIYRGDRLRVDRDGFRGLFYKSQLLETDISLSGNPPVGDGNDARRGMPDLDPLLELGPAARGFLYRGRRLSSLYLEGTVRGVVAVDVDDGEPRDVGWRAVLDLVAPRFVPGSGSPWTFGSRLGVEFTDRRYNAYFYDVSEEQALPDREAYESEAGYGGTHLSAYVMRKVRPDLSILVYGRWDNLEGAVYEDSPLVRTHNNLIAGAAVIWKLAESRTRVRWR